MFRNKSKLPTVLKHFQEWGISCGTISSAEAPQGCLLSTLAVAHRKTTWHDLRYNGSSSVIYYAHGRRKKDVHILAEVIRELYPEFNTPQLAQNDIKVCWEFNDTFARQHPENIIHVVEVAIARQQGKSLPDIQGGQIGEPQRKIILIPEEEPVIPAPSPEPKTTPVPAKVPEKEPVPV